MKKFLLKTSLYTLLCFIILSLVLVFYGSYIDYFYEKFTSPKAQSMIIGDSRGMQGIQPRIINEELKNSSFQLPVLNYSFTIAQAAIGPLYNTSIHRKLDQTGKDGLFIISITPWMLSSDKANDNSKGEFREANGPPHNLKNVSSNPNYEYVFKNLSYFHFQGLFGRNAKMHKDGWLEENNLPKDSTVFKRWKENQKQMMLRLTKDYEVSDLRLKSLDSLIKSLSSYGKVYMLRTPIDKEFLEIENLFFPEFDQTILALAEKHKIKYRDFNKLEYRKDYKTYDGHHLDKYGGVFFTKDICNFIKSN